MGAGGDAAVEPIGIPLPPGARRYAVLQCGADSEYVKREHGGYFYVYAALLREEGEEWHLFRAVDGELPSDEEADGFDGFVVTGSAADADADDPWILALVGLLRHLHARRKRVLGICFGHQILCRALGGKTGRSARGWDIGVTQVRATYASAKLFAALGIPKTLPVFEIHRDEIWELPPHAELLAESDHTGIEMFRVGHHIMGIQGHPEYTRELLESIIDRLHHKDLVEDCVVEAARASIAAAALGAADGQEGYWKSLCRGFLKGRLGWWPKQGSLWQRHCFLPAQSLDASVDSVAKGEE